MNYAGIKYFDIANGPGVRTTLFVSGCTHHCKGCFQPETWNFNYGEHFSDEVQNQIISSLDNDNIAGLTLLGGEPMEPQNQEGIYLLVKLIRDIFGDTKSIWCYTGDLFEDLICDTSSRNTEYTVPILENIDVLVDGQFDENLHEFGLRFKGSTNQRIIDTRKSIVSDDVVLWEDDPMFCTHKLGA